jgi:hypothetical protein
VELHLQVLELQDKVILAILQTTIEDMVEVELRVLADG